MPEDSENEVVETQNEEQPQAATAEEVASMKETIAAMDAKLAEIQAAKAEIAEEQPLTAPKRYSAEAIDELVEAKLNERLKPVAAQIEANERMRAEELRDGLIAQHMGLTDEETNALRTVAQKQFDTGAATNMEEAISHGRSILGLEKPKQDTASQEARRAGRRGAQGRAPLETADMSEDEALEAIFVEHGITD